MNPSKGKNMHHFKTSLLRTVSLALLVIGTSAIAQAQTFAYVALSRAQQVSVIDTSTNTVVASIPTDSQPLTIIVSPDGSRAYVSTLASTPVFPVLPAPPNISVIDTATNTVVAKIPLPHLSFYLAISPDGTRLYASDPSFSGVGVSVIDTSTNSVVASIPTPGRRPYGLAITPDGAHLYIAAAYTGDIFIADTATNAVVDAISDPDVLYTEGLALSPDGSRLYAGSTTGFRTIDTATKTQLALGQPGGVNISVTPDGTKAYLIGAAVDGGDFWVDDTATNTVTPHGLIGIGDDGAWVQAAFTPDSAFAYVTDYLQGRVVVFDTTSTAKVAEIALGYQTGVRGIAIGTLPPTTPFAAFDVSRLVLNSQGVSEAGSFSLASTSQASAAAASTGIDPVTQPVTFTIGSYVLDIPAGTFRKNGANLHWKYEGTLNGVKLNIDIKQHGQSTTQFDYMFDAKNGPVLTGLPRPIRVGLKIGRNVGTALVP
ncbi:MAG TPA: YncE family protein [Thermoanaerobaculia bacterium]|jgi:YVTN family beta-propeller protein|nr:YncE family protein [Thermoanaerobaculia bacterium]